ncbi:3',5'-cyclic-nucleotide phosphodiesterase regA [Pelomyxa schiedti]|nr:3',5'-cyclic-nucleotide phosphodiesterase regA [Pelomyxa schiedti]
MGAKWRRGTGGKCCLFCELLFKFALCAFLAVTGVNGGKWAVCTLEGLISLTKNAVMEIQPPYIELQHQIESVAAALSFLEEHANSEERLLWKSWLADKMTIVTDGDVAGCAVDYDPNRYVESGIRSSALVPQPVNRSEPCPCNPFWLQWLNSNYPDPNTGMPCDTYCTVSKHLALSRHIAAVATANTEELKYMPRMWGSSTNFSVSSVPSPWSVWVVLYNTTSMHVTHNPDFKPPYMHLVEPQNDPGKTSKWSDPFYPLYDMQIQVLTPLYLSSGKFAFVLMSTISMADTSKYIMDNIISTPNGFNLLLSSTGCILSASGLGYTTLFGSSLNLTVKSQVCLSKATDWDFTEFLLGLGTSGTDTIIHGNETWVFSRYPLDLLPWTVVIAVPASDITSSGEFSVSPEGLVAEVLPTDLHASFILHVNNTGVVPLMLEAVNISSFLLYNLTGVLYLNGSESATILVQYIGDELPFSGRVQLYVRDAVTELGLCFNTEISVPVTISKSQIAFKIGISIGAVIACTLTVAVVVLLLVIRHFKRKISILSQPLSTHLMKTPAEAAIKKLKGMQKKRKLTREDSLVLDKIIQLIACNGLHRVDFTAQKKARLNECLDDEVDKYLLEHISPYSNESKASDDQHSAVIVEQWNNMPLPMSNLDDWNFCVFKYTPDKVLQEVALPIFKTHGLLERFRINQDLFTNWLVGIAKGYLSNPYHNVIHAADVLQAVHVLLLNFAPSVYDKIPALSLLALFFAAVIHDFGHPGVTNNFLYRILDPLALTYNGISILENMHLKEAFEFTLHNCNWLSFMTQQEFLEFHQMVTNIVLATDMSKHVEVLSQFKSKLTVDGFDLSKTGDVTLIFQMILKMSDINNQTRPWETARTWTDLIMEEFYRQGDQEAEKSLPKSPFMDRGSTRVPTCQSAFIKFFVSPVLDAVSKYIDSQFKSEQPTHKKPTITPNGSSLLQVVVDHGHTAGGPSSPSSSFAHQHTSHLPHTTSYKKHKLCTLHENLAFNQSQWAQMSTAASKPSTPVNNNKRDSRASSKPSTPMSHTNNNQT